MRDPVAAVGEAEATGEIAAIFADIRAVYRVGVVNLVWRHLATLPGALPWVWGTVRPAYVAGLVGREAAAFRAGLVLPEVPALPEGVMQAAGLDAAARAGIGAVLAGYDRTNAMALLALSAVLARLDGVAGGGPMPAVEAAEDAAPVVLPRLPALRELTPETAALVEALNRFGSEEAAPLLASMYRHLSYWPPCLALGWTQLAPLEADGRLAAAIAAVPGQARDGALLLAGAMPALTRPPEMPAEAVRAAVARFTEGPIGRMVVICAVLRQGWGAAGG